MKHNHSFHKIKRFGHMEFISLTIISILAVVLIIRYSLNTRVINPTNSLKVIFLIIVLETFCMLLGKFGANWGFPWWVYYPIPMMLTLFFPAFYFRMTKKETIKYLVLTIISAPIIHIVFSLTGWKNYMPFIKIPSLFELIR